MLWLGRPFSQVVLGGQAFTPNPFEHDVHHSELIKSDGGNRCMNTNDQAAADTRNSAGANMEVKVWRGGESGAYQVYNVPRRDNQTVLDVVTWIQRNADPTLSYRFACRVGVCGSCAMTVNGRPRWTCRTHVATVVDDGYLEIAPLSNLPVIKDLTTDMSRFFEKWRQAEGNFKPTATRNDPVAAISPSDETRVLADEAIECINCGICFAACDTVRWNPDYLGPAALNRAWTLVNDVRDGAKTERLKAVAADGGCHACHTHQSCEAHCPQGLNPTASIAGLKRLTMHAYLRGDL